MYMYVELHYHDRLLASVKAKEDDGISSFIDIENYSELLKAYLNSPYVIADFSELQYLDKWYSSIDYFEKENEEEDVFDYALRHINELVEAIAHKYNLLIKK